MSEFLRTNDLLSKIERIITEAEDHVILVSPYLLIPKSLIPSINHALSRGIGVTIVFGKREELKENERLRLLEIAHENFKLLYHQDLHGKAYFNEKEAVVASLNLFESSSRNYEFGVFFTKNDSNKMYVDLGKYINQIIRSSHVVPIDWDKTINFVDPATGYCIRCSVSISYNMFKPYCPDCYDVWKKYKNKDYKENSCHKCNNSTPSTIKSPLCEDCLTM
jgi:hypothetical protein